MAFHAWSQVSLTHSSASSSPPRMFFATDRHSAAYFRWVSLSAASSRRQYSATICPSSIPIPLSSSLRALTQ